MTHNNSLKWDVRPGFAGAAGFLAPLAFQIPAHGLLGCGMVAQVFGKQTLKLAHGLLALELRLVLRKSLDIKAVD